MVGGLGPDPLPPPKSGPAWVRYCTMNFTGSTSSCDRVLFKLAVTVHRCLNGRTPPYLSDYCVPVASADTRRHFFCTNCLWSYLGPYLTSLRYVMYFRFCGWRHVFIPWTGHWAKIKHVVFRRSSPGGGISWTSDNSRVWSSSSECTMGRKSAIYDLLILLSCGQFCCSDGSVSRNYCSLMLVHNITVKWRSNSF